jgi:Domain of unknown function (DUF5659)
VNEYVTSDLQIASFLKTIGHEPVRVEGPSGRRVFVFVGVPPDAVSSYYAGTRPVAPYDLFSSYRSLKRRLY